MGVIRQETEGELMDSEPTISVSAEELLDELVSRIAQLNMELAAKNVVIRKLEEKINNKEWE